MTEPYSLDFRQKVVEASKIFNISGNTIDLWLKRRDETGNLKPMPNKPPGSNHRIIDWQKFREFANRHGDKTEKQMAELWEGEISLRTISRALKKIGFSRKKNLWLPRTGRRETSSISVTDSQNRAQGYYLHR